VSLVRSVLGSLLGRDSDARKFATPASQFTKTVEFMGLILGCSYCLALHHVQPSMPPCYSSYCFSPQIDRHVWQPARDPGPAV
jgi:hypothetical protein